MTNFHEVSVSNYYISYPSFINLLDIIQIAFTCKIENDIVINIDEISLISKNYFELAEKKQNIYSFRTTDSIGEELLKRINSDLDVDETIENFDHIDRYYSINKFDKVFKGSNVQRSELLEKRHPFRAIYSIFNQNDVNINEFFSDYFNIKKNLSDIEDEKQDKLRKMEQENENHNVTNERLDDNSWMDHPSDYWNID